MFVFDVSDTEGERDAPALPRDVTHPFEARSGNVGAELEATIENAKRDGIRVIKHSAGSQSAGSISHVRAGAFQDVVTRRMPRREVTSVPVRYDLLLNAELSREAQYVTLLHELAHLYCGHLGTPDSTWWPDRVSLPAGSEVMRVDERECFVDKDGAVNEQTLPQKRARQRVGVT
jgi:hypothetical protein